MKKIIMAALAIGVALVSQAQSTNRNRMSIDYQYRTPAVRMDLGNPPGSHYTGQPGVNVSYGHMLTDVWEVGASCAFLPSEFTNYENPGTFDNRLVLAPGLYSRLHLLSAAGVESTRFDLCIEDKIGGAFASGCSLEYGIGLTGQYYPLRHLGISATVEFGNFTIARYLYTNTSHFQMSCGLTWRW